MNYLAHAYLSFNDPEILTGNMISDFIRGKQFDQFEGNIRNGILLHRYIDQFTDEHPVTQNIKTLFKNDFRLYASPITDVIYDYFVANDPDNFSSKENLMSFTQDTYRLLHQNEIHFPERFRTIFPYMQSQNWLYHYGETDGIFKSLKGLERRASYLNNIEKAFEIFLTNREYIHDLYNQYFSELRAGAQQKILILQQPSI